MRSSCTLFAAILFALAACHTSAATSRVASDVAGAPIAFRIKSVCYTEVDSSLSPRSTAKVGARRPHRL